MTYRDQILSSPETLSDLDWAAEQRYRDAEELLHRSRYAGAVYLLGLASEMWLKLACFRLRGATPSTTVDAVLAPAAKWMNVNAPGIDREAYHSLAFWAEYLMRVRASTGSPLPAHLTGELRHHVVRRLYEDWKIDMRYRSIPVSQFQARRVYHDVAWVRHNWPKLWR
jgi:hypothetical protein